ncbi:coiled-coil domain-containing protein 83 [Pelodiscus sinensis]|uniref:Coiled-coil domain containing 83 n=1 Tax=Pelodiscus sinensis TaxID=13735 RepID=K7FIA0_PELSI|nr:coiled-coil domain-containing protein 83 [Pelodiscus sinensis]|eukprot:XP_025038040.1 coiled-coil domain-containing protein 83 [Pelodiscus sinensis]
MGKKKKKKENQVGQLQARSSFPEALLAFQIQLKEEAINQLLFELKQLKEKNDKYHERNDCLKAEQLGHIRDLLSDLKIQEKELEQKETVTRDDVEAAMREKWQYVRDQEMLLKELRSKVKEVDQKLVIKQAEKDYWLEYKNVGSGEHAKQIKLLEENIRGLKDDLEQMTEYYRYTLGATKEKMDRLAEKQMNQKKEWATENAVKHIDKTSHREIEENEWLKEEVEIYRTEVSDLEESAQLLEEENIYMIKSLFNCRLKNLKVSRHLFLTQGAGLQVQGEELLSEDLEGLQCRDYAAKTDAGDESPESTVLTIEQKVFSDTQSETEAEKQEYSYEDLWGQPVSPVFSSILYEDEKDFQEYLKLGPLETKLMSAVGTAMPIHEELREMPSKCQFEDSFETYKSEGHITYRMVKSVFN